MLQIVGISTVAKAVLVRHAMNGYIILPLNEVKAIGNNLRASIPFLEHNRVAYHFSNEIDKRLSEAKILYTTYEMTLSNSEKITNKELDDLLRRRIK